MASKSRNKAAMDAERVARMTAEYANADDEPQDGPAADASSDAPEIAPSSPMTKAVEVEPPTVEAEPVAALSERSAVVPEPLDDEPEFDPGKVDGRTLRKTGREPFATRIKPETHATLRRIAYARRITMAEALEMAVASFDSHRKA